jgi:hypothetical protein
VTGARHLARRSKEFQLHGAGTLTSAHHTRTRHE